MVDRTVVQTITTGATPVWAIARSDSARVYVLNSGAGTVSAIDTATDLVVGTATVGAGANFMAYDNKLNRLYITNPTASTLTAVSIESDPPTVLFTVPVPAGVTNVASLPDGTRAYVVSSQKGPPCTSNPSDAQACISSQVTVINSTSGTVKTTIPLEPRVNPYGCVAKWFDHNLHLHSALWPSSSAGHGNCHRRDGRPGKTMEPLIWPPQVLDHSR